MKHEKIAPGLMVAYEQFRGRGDAALGPLSRTLGIVHSAGTPKPPRTVVFVDCDAKANLDHLATHDIRVNQPAGRIRTAVLPLASLDQLSEDGAIRRIIPARYLHPLMDVAAGAVHVPQFRAAKNRSGSGVIVGIIDTGIDASHAAFDGRILQIWDQTLPGPGVAEGQYGAELSSALFRVSRDMVGHGTHVAGIAAGADPKFTGVAPEAEFVIVKTDFMDAHIADAVRYVCRVAKDMNRPVVINLSLGGHFGAHDGSEALSQVIDEASGPGRIVCCAAGNEGNDNIHATAQVAPGAVHTIRFRVPPGSVHDMVLNGWYPGSNSLEISLRSPSKIVTPFQPVITAGSPAQEHLLPDGVVNIATPGPDPSNGDHNFVVDIQGRSGLPVADGIWQLRVRNTSAGATRLDVWALDDQEAPVVTFSGNSVSDSMKIGSPGSAAAAVTVAAYTTRVEWLDIDEKTRSVGLHLNDISEFSSEGPLRNGARKPDVAAPGAMIVSCLSTDSSVERAEMVNRNFRVMAGTSMATPFVTGLVALLLQGDRSLDPKGIKMQLGTHCRIPGKAENTFDDKWGFGLIDAMDL
ncbi:peptidase S8 [Herbaspirillum sp. HC18]|nr:peptidase S8 [Herbaspirillum sp. HC18]